MKIGELASFGHNVADSLASGVCLMVGIYWVDIYEEAATSPEGHITVDFKTGSTTGSPVSADLKEAVRRYSDGLAEFAEQHRLDAAKIKVLTARFGTDPVIGRHFSVTVEDSDGRQSVDRYVGCPGKRFGRSRRTHAV